MTGERTFNQNNALIYTLLFFVWKTACHGWVHEKRPKDTEEPWIPSEEQREQAKAGLKSCFWAFDRDKSGRIGFFGSSGRTSGFSLQIGTVLTRSGRLATWYGIHGWGSTCTGMYGHAMAMHILLRCLQRFKRQARLCFRVNVRLWVIALVSQLPWLTITRLWEKRLEYNVSSLSTQRFAG